MIKSSSLQTGSHLVEVGEARGQTGQHRSSTFHLLNFFEQLLGDRFHMHKALANAFVGELKDCLLGVVKNYLRVILFLRVPPE